jgi:hypothetical protein
MQFPLMLTKKKVWHKLIAKLEIPSRALACCDKKYVRLQAST